MDQEAQMGHFSPARKIFDSYMVIVGILGQLVFYAQAYKIFTTQSAGDVSSVGFSIGLISVASWLAYGIVIKSRPLIIGNIVAVLGASLVLIGISLYS